MKKFRNMRYVPLLLTILLLVMIAAPMISMAAQPTVNLGSTVSFAVLAGSTITNTGTTIINGDAGGDVGLHPGTVFTGATGVSVSGAVHLADNIASAAKADLIIAYDDAAGRTPVTRIPTELGGTTLTPGMYDSADGTFQITGTLTLDAQGDPDGVFIFKTASTLITASGSNVNLINSARYCRTFWPVGSSATLGTDSHFVGHIFAMSSITANNGATVQGQLLARNGAVTLDNNVITNGICLTSLTTTPSPAPTTTPSPSSTGGDVKDVETSPPLIKITKTPDPLELTSGPGSVAYTYEVTNPGTEPLSDVRVTDDKIRTVNYSTGDTNSDDLLQPSETWIYTSSAILGVTTKNTATATGSANDMTASDTAAATVVVTVPVVATPSAAIIVNGEIPLDTITPPAAPAPTITGGELPKTASPWYNLLLAGTALMLIGAVSWRLKTR